MNSSPTYPVFIEKLIYHGWGLGTINGVKVLVPQTVPGDQVTVRIKKKEKRLWHGVKISLDVPSADREHPPCPHATDCGGCQLQEIRYNKQIEFKSDMIIDAARHHHLTHLIPAIRPVIMCDSPFYYRNKMEFAFGHDNTGNIILGLKRRGHFDQIVPVSSCLLQDPESNEILQFTQSFFNTYSPSTWNYHTHTGWLRYLVLRQSKIHHNWMVNLVVSTEESTQVADFTTAIMQQFRNIVSVFCTISNTAGDTASAPNIHLISGQDHLKESIGDYEFKISPLSFFQTNSLQAKLLYDQVAKIAQMVRPNLALDLYCGTGTIGIYIARYCNQVIGVEENSAAISDAIENARINQIKNISFECNRVKNVLKHTSWKPELVVIDPPRSGMVPKALQRIIALESPHIVYVSCNPVTLFRDLNLFESAGYHIQFIQPVDMFAHTYHVECVVHLIKHP